MKGSLSKIMFYMSKNSRLKLKMELLAKKPLKTLWPLFMDRV